MPIKLQNKIRFCLKSLISISLVQNLNSCNMNDLKCNFFSRIHHPLVIFNQKVPDPWPCVIHNIQDGGLGERKRMGFAFRCWRLYRTSILVRTQCFNLKDNSTMDFNQFWILNVNFSRFWIVFIWTSAESVWCRKRRQNKAKYVICLSFSCI